jgi:hypothetical protein
VTGSAVASLIEHSISAACAPSYRPNYYLPAINRSRLGGAMKDQ